MQAAPACGAGSHRTAGNLPAGPLAGQVDARYRARTLGDFSYFYGFMSQPKFQLEVRFGRCARFFAMVFSASSIAIPPHALPADLQGVGRQILRH